MPRTVAIHLVVLLALSICPTALLGDEASAIAWVQQNEGTVTRDEEHPERPIVEVDVGRQFGHRDQNVDDTGLEQLAAFPELKRLNLAGSEVTVAMPTPSGRPRQTGEITFFANGRSQTTSIA